MQVNGINCTDYKRDGVMVTLLLTDTTFEEIEALDFSTLNVTTNTGALAETLTGFSELVTIGKNVGTGVFTVVARIPSDLEKQINDVESWAGQQLALLNKQNADLTAENKQLIAKLEASIKSNQMLEDCLVEMAEIVYA